MQDIEKMLEGMDREAKNIRTEALKMCWHLRGGISYNEAMALSMQERTIIAEIVQENMETTKKTGLPYF